LDTTRVLIAVILSLGLIFAYQELVLKRMYPPQPEQEQAKASALATPVSVPSAAQSAAAAPSAAAAAVATTAAHTVAAPVLAGSLKPAGPPATAPRDVTVETPLYTAVVSMRGGRITSFLLSKYKETAARDSPQYQMISLAAPQNLPMELLVAHGGSIANDAGLDYSTSAPGEIKVPAGGESKLELTATAEDG
jgi:YidC/Oxa1 family membrane protein insertase